MKKVISLILTTVLLICFAGCSSEAIKIEGYEWNLTLIQSNEDGSIIGCGSAYYEEHKDIENIITVNLVCSAENGSFTITDKTNDTSYSGNYKTNNSSGDSTIYSITTATNSGTAVSSLTKSNDDNNKTENTPTLIITIGNYVLNFQAK